MLVKDQKLRRAGLKATLPRLKILEVMQQSDQRHMTADSIFQALLDAGERKVGLATVYRALAQFEIAGIIERQHFESGSAVFELADSEHHDHIVCTRCGKVVEFCDEVIEQRQEALAESLGFRLQSHSHSLFGECLDDSSCTESDA